MKLLNKLWETMKFLRFVTNSDVVVSYSFRWRIVLIIRLQSTFADFVLATFQSTSGALYFHHNL